MPTPDDAVAAGQLHKIDGGLDAAEQEQRLLYAMPRAVRWMNDKLEGLDADGYHENAQSPMMQADDLFYTFVSGGVIESDWPPHVMRPPREGGMGIAHRRFAILWVVLAQRHLHHFSCGSGGAMQKIQAVRWI